MAVLTMTVGGKEIAGLIKGQPIGFDSSREDAFSSIRSEFEDRVV
jgi:hypothetical protein